MQCILFYRNLKDQERLCSWEKLKESKSEGGMGLNIVRGLVDNLEIKPKKIGTKFEILKEVEEETK